MNKFKLLVSAALVLAATSTFASKDQQVLIGPLGSIKVPPYNLLSEWKYGSLNNGRTVICTLAKVNPADPMLDIMVTSSNFKYNPNDNQDGIYELVDNIPAVYIKNLVQPLDQNYQMTIRTYQLNNLSGSGFTTNCNYKIG
jgi:hypothetical protein